MTALGRAMERMPAARTCMEHAGRDEEAILDNMAEDGSSGSYYQSGYRLVPKEKETCDGPSGLGSMKGSKSLVASRGWRR